MQEVIKPRKLSHKGARKKGARLEYDVRDALIRIGIGAKRVPMSGALAWLKGDVAELDRPYDQRHIHECKNCETLSLKDWWCQAATQALNGEVPVLEFSSNHKPIYAMLRNGDFDDLVYRYELRRRELTLTLIDFPKRNIFWKFVAKFPANPFNVFLTDITYIPDKKKPLIKVTDEVVIIPFETYLLLRKESLTPLA